MKKIAIVTGGSSGIGRFTAKSLSERGCIVYDLSRRHIPQENIKHLKTDVTDENNVVASINEIVNAEGRIDIVVNCAGFGISGAVEFTDIEEAKRQFNVNFFGKCAAS